MLFTLANARSLFKTTLIPVSSVTSAAFPSLIAIRFAADWLLIVRTALLVTMFPATARDTGSGVQPAGHARLGAGMGSWLASQASVMTLGRITTKVSVTMPAIR